MLDLGCGTTKGGIALASHGLPSSIKVAKIHRAMKRLGLACQQDGSHCKIVVLDDDKASSISRRKVSSSLTGKKELSANELDVLLKDLSKIGIQREDFLKEVCDDKHLRQLGIEVAKEPL